MRSLQGIDDLSGDAQRLLHPNGARGNAISERQSLDELHRKRRTALPSIDAVDLRDVRMIERGQYFRLSLKSCEAASIVGKVQREYLQGDVTFQVEISGAVDLAHPARTDQADDFVRPKACTAGNRHALS